MEHDKWKQGFLMRLEEEHKIEQLWKNRSYVVLGVLFYNATKTRRDFEREDAVILAKYL